MVFTKKSALTQLLFVLFLFAILIPTAIWDSNSQVKVRLEDTSVFIKSDKYTMDVPYADIASAELAELSDPGEGLENAFDDKIIRTGKWSNDTWGEYYIVADLDTTTCVVLHHEDGRTFVFSCKNDKKTAELFNELQTHLN